MCYRQEMLAAGCYWEKIMGPGYYKNQMPVSKYL